MKDWIRTGDWSAYRKAGLLSSPTGSTFKLVLLFFEQVENPAYQHDLGYFNYFTNKWHLYSAGETGHILPSHFQLLTAPEQ